ncbi:MAG: hypothetical protein WC718_11155 [Phycisphaerales bacterium]|jgi:hypothetical protein
MITVGQQGGKILPVGEGIGATQLVWAVSSPARAAAKLMIFTVAEPLEIIPGPPGTQVGNEHGLDISLMRAAAAPPMVTVAAPGGMMSSGSAGCGAGVGVGAGG